MAKTGNSQRVHELLRRKYFEPARRRRARTVRVVAGELARELGMMLRVPQVCTAMQGGRFLREQGLEIVERQGPPSGQSTTFAIIYRLRDRPAAEKGFDALAGSAKHYFDQGDSLSEFIKRERAEFDRKPE